MVNSNYPIVFVLAIIMSPISAILAQSVYHQEQPASNNSSPSSSNGAASTSYQGTTANNEATSLTNLNPIIGNEPVMPLPYGWITRTNIVSNTVGNICINPCCDNDPYNIVWEGLAPDSVGCIDYEAPRVVRAQVKDRKGTVKKLDIHAGCLPLSDESIGLVTKDTFLWMKPSAYPVGVMRYKNHLISVLPQFLELDYYPGIDIMLGFSSYGKLANIDYASLFVGIKENRVRLYQNGVKVFEKTFPQIIKLTLLTSNTNYYLLVDGEVQFEGITPLLAKLTFYAWSFIFNQLPLDLQRFTFSGCEPIKNEEICHTQLKDKLDAGYIIAWDGKLKFSFNQRYEPAKDETLMYEIFGPTGKKLSTTTPISILPGTNNVTLKLEPANDYVHDEYYTIEVRINKGERAYQRFRYKSPPEKELAFTPEKPENQISQLDFVVENITHIEKPEATLIQLDFPPAPQSNPINGSETPKK